MSPQTAYTALSSVSQWQRLGWGLWHPHLEARWGAALANGGGASGFKNHSKVVGSVKFASGLVRLRHGGSIQPPPYSAAFNTSPAADRTTATALNIAQRSLR